MATQMVAIRGSDACSPAGSRAACMRVVLALGVAILGSTAFGLDVRAAVSGKLQIFASTENEERTKAQDEVVAGFTRLFPNVKVEMMRTPWPWYTRFETLLSAGMPPDLWMSAGMYASNLYVDMGVWKDVNPLIARDKLNLNQYFQPVLDATTFQGMRFGLPVGMFTDAVIYNVDLFEEAGLPRPPHDYSDRTWTWEKYVEYGRRLTRDTNGDGTPEIWGIDGIGHLDTVIKSFGGFPFSADFKQALFDSPAVRAAWQLAQDVVYRYRVSPTYEERVAQNLGGIAFDKGVAGMLIDFTTRAGNYVNRKDLRFDVAAKPRGPAGPSVLLYLNTVNILANAPNAEAAWEWAKYVSRPDVLPRLAVYGFNAIPPTRDGAALFVQRMKELRPDVDWTVFVRGAEYAFPVEYWRPKYKEIDAAVAAVRNEVLRNTQNVTAGLQALDAQVQAILDAYWAERAKQKK